MRRAIAVIAMIVLRQRGAGQRQQCGAERQGAERRSYPCFSGHGRLSISRHAKVRAYVTAISRDTMSQN
jgi:hypothetical protein